MTKAPKSASKAKWGKTGYKTQGKASRLTQQRQARASRSRALQKERIRTIQNQLAKVWFDLYGMTVGSEEE